MKNICYTINRFDEQFENYTVVLLKDEVVLNFENVSKLDKMIEELKHISNKAKEYIYFSNIYK